ncbi:hypothetical protein Hanom_Chr13g01207921 [Helianthus anomalus]
MASNTYTRVGATERNISEMQDDISHIRQHMVYKGGDDEEKTWIDVEALGEVRHRRQLLTA